MQEILKQVRTGIDNNLYLLVLNTALTLPDICGAVETNNGIAKGQKYRKWYNENVFPFYDGLTAEECYDFRCKLLHQGQTKSKKSNSNFSKIVFAEPQPKGGGGKIYVSINRITINNEAGPRVIDMIEFVESILKGVESWMERKEGTEPYTSNIKKCIDRHPEGLPPIFGGFPFIY